MISMSDFANGLHKLVDQYSAEVGMNEPMKEIQCLRYPDRLGFVLRCYSPELIEIENAVDEAWERNGERR